MVSNDGQTIVTFKAGLNGFNCFQRRFNHNIEVKLINQDFEGGQFVCLNNGDLVVGIGSKVFFICGSSYKVQNEIDLNVIDNKAGREPMVILSMNKSFDDLNIAVIFGKQLIGDVERILQISVLRKERNSFSYFHFKDLDLTKFGLSHFCKKV